MISTVSLSFDLTYVDPLTGTVIPRCVVTDSTDYAGLADFDLVLQQAKGYGVLTFNGDVIDSKNSVGDPLIDLQNWNFGLDGTPTGYFDLPLDLNGNVANGLYGISYSLRLTEGAPNPTGSASSALTLSGYEWMSDFFEVGDSITLTPVVPGFPSSRTISSINYTAGNTVITLNTPVSPSGSYDLTYDVSNVQFSATYSYAGCTQVSADVNFIYDCEYGDFGTWSVSNTTNLASGEIVSSLNCTVNYPSWTTTPPVVISSLPYPTTPSLTPLATGTYTVVLSQQIQQTQVSGLVVLYNNSVIKEFAVTCAGTLCGLVPCIENLRAAHATELIRNRISKYQVFVDNVALYYMQAMNYRACGELDKYRETLTLLEAQLDASGCECSCCDDNTYYWVSNNSATSVIDELLANIQYRLYDGGGDDPGALRTSVEFGAIWQDVSTGILYRCTNATPGELEWEVYYNPAGTILAIDVIATPNAPLTAGTVQGQLQEIAADFIYDGANGINKTGTNLELGGILNQNTTIDINTRSFDLVGTTGDVTISATSGTALYVEGTASTLDVLATNSTAAILKVERAVDNTVAVNLALRTSVDSAAGADGLGSSIQFSSEGATSSIVTTGSIESVLTSASAPTQGNLKFNTRSTSGLINPFTLNPDGSATLPLYGDGNITGTPTYSLGVDVDGNIIETNSIAGASNGLTEFANNIELGGSLTKPTTISRGVNDLTISGTTSSVSITGSDISPSLSVSNSTGRAFSSQGVHSVGSAVFNTLDLAGSNTASPTLLLAGFSLVPGNGYGTSLRFSANEPTASYTGYMSSIISTWQNASAKNSKLDITTTLAGVESTALTINPNASVTLPLYGDGNFTGDPAYFLGVDVNGNVIESGASNGLSISSGDIVLGGSLDAATTIDLNTRNLTFSGTSGNLIVESTIGTALDVTGTTNTLDVLATTDTAATLQVERATNNDVATNLVVRTSVSGGAGLAGLGSSIEFRSEGTSSLITTSSIESVVTNPTTGRGELKFNVKAGGPTVANSLTLNDDLSITLPSYGDGNYTGTATRSLSVDVDGNVIETAALPKVYLATITQSGTGNPTATVILNTTGETITWNYIGVGTYNAVITNSIFASGKTAVSASLGGYAPSPYDGALVGVGGQRLSTSVVQLLSFGAPNRLGVQDDIALSNGVLYNATVRIEIYP